MLTIDHRGRFAAVAHIVEHHSRDELARILGTCPADVGAAIRERVARKGFRLRPTPELATHRGQVR
jgi:hypothetical protein